MQPDRASLESFVGSYSVETGGRRGTLRLVRRGAFLHAEATLDDGGDVRDGLAMPFAGRLVMAVGPKDKVEIGAYRVVGDRLEGLWVPPGADQEDFAKCGRENSVGGDLRGARPWTIADAVAIDGQAYHGTIKTEPAAPLAAVKLAGEPAPIRITWNLHDGDFQSFGLAYADALYTTFSFEPEKPYGVIVYGVAGDTLHGRRLDSGSYAITTETLRRQR